MLFYTKTRVSKHERALLFRNGDFVRFLEPGVHRFWSFKDRYSVTTFSLATPRFRHPLADYLVSEHAADVAERFELVDTSADEIAVVYFDGKPDELVGPKERALYWKGYIDVRVERHSLAGDLALEPRLVRELLDGDFPIARAGALQRIFSIVVPEAHAGILTVDGKIDRVLEPGRHAFWQTRQGVAAELIDLRVKTLEVSGQEILTRDKVALRINLTATYRVADALKAVREVQGPLEQLYKAAQFALRSVVGTRTLDTLLEDKGAIDKDVGELLVERAGDLGFDVLNVGVKDIILPGDMKELLGKVVEAEKAAQANVIRRREETNATRSLLNTAKVMESNAVALRLKELETLEKITDKIGQISVYGGLDSVLSDLVRLNK